MAQVNYVHRAEELPIWFKHKLVDYKGVPLHEDFAEHMPTVEAFECNDKDILLASYQKTGSTWLDAIVTLILNNGDPKSIVSNGTWDISSRKYLNFLFIEFKWSFQTFFGNDTMLHYIKQWDSPKTMRTHLPYSLLPRDVERNHPKVIYIYRDVKDVMVSHYYHYMYHNYKIVDRLGTFEEFAEDFMAGRIAYGNFFAHLHGYWAHRHEPNFFVTSYETLLKDRRGVTEKVAAFLGKPLSEDELENIMRLTSKEYMTDHNDETWRRNFTVKDENGKQLHHFIRNGKSGGWREEFSPELAAKTDAWIADSLQKYSFDCNPFEC